MRLTIEPTEDPANDFVAMRSPKVIVEVASDMLDIEEVGELLQSLLMAWGFHPANVNELIHTDVGPGVDPADD